MVVIDRVFAGAAVQTTVSGTMTPSVPGAGGTFTVADATGYPASGKFGVKLNRGLSDEEHVLINSRAGTTFTVGQRGFDGTTAQDHDNPTCEIYFDATAANLLVDHVNDVEATPHATKLPVGTIAGHDVTARHAFGAALGTPGTPAALTPDIAGAAGSGTVPARSDHVHNVPAATAGTLTGANAEGVAASFARSDHDHAFTFGTPGAIAPDDIASAGVAITPARSDHRHGFTSATAVALTKTATASEGVASTHARSDHVHATSVLPFGLVVTTGNIETPSSGLTTDSTIADMSLSNVPYTQDRHYLWHFQAATTLAGNSAIWSIWLRLNGANYCRLFQHRTNSVGDEQFKWVDAWRIFVPPATIATDDWTIFCQEELGSGTFSLGGSASDTFRSLSLYDMGI